METRSRLGRPGPLTPLSFAAFFRRKLGKEPYAPALQQKLLSLRSGRKKPGTFRRKGERFAFEGFFPKISEQSEEIFCFQAGEGLPLAFGFRVGRALAFPLRGEGKQIPCGNLLDEVESFLFSP